jgi:Transport and Golgi organisation 2
MTRILRGATCITLTPPHENDPKNKKNKQKNNRTNITEDSTPHASSRGTLAASFLADPRGGSDLERATAALTSHDALAATSYAGFNLLLLEPLPGTAATPMLAYDARLLTNGGQGGRIRARMLSPAEYAYGGTSNGVDGEGGEAWPKVVQGKAAFRSILELEEEDQGTTGGPEIADADSRLAERLIELLTYVTAVVFPAVGWFLPRPFLFRPRIVLFPTLIPCAPSWPHAYIPRAR